MAWAAALAVAGALGCNSLWDDVTSRDFSIKSAFTRGPDPLEVLKESKDGDKRARAYRALAERDLESASPEEKEYVLTLLEYGVISEPQVWTRMAAVQALARHRDARAVKALKDGYYRASSFPSESATILKCQILTALGQTEHPDAIELLVRVLKEPPLEGSEVEKQQKTDERIAAAHALGSFPHQEAVEPLLETLRSEKDIALRDRANESLQQITGQDLPPEAVAWEKFLNDPANKDRTFAQNKSFGERIQELMPVGFRR